MVRTEYGPVFREAYATLHGSGPGEAGNTAERGAGEGIETYLARTRSEALQGMRNRLMGMEPPPELLLAHQLLLDLLTNAVAADEALAEQVRSYQCGQFHESVAHSDRLQKLVTSSQRMDRDLILEIQGLPAAVREELAIDV